MSPIETTKTDGMADVVLEARGVTKSFPGVRALSGVDIAVRRGEVHALVGENGAGKSTLMLILAGIYRPDEGEIRVQGQTVDFSSPHDANKKGISIVFQELSLVPFLSIAENIFANRQPTGAFGFVDWRELNRRTQELLATFDLGRLDPTMPVKELSMANQQVVEILKAISLDPRVLILDEPTSSLTGMEVERLFQIIRQLKKRGLSFIYTSHHLPEIYRIADTVTVLRDGARVIDARVADIDEDFLITHMVGRKIGNMYGTRAPEDQIGDIRFSANHLSRKGLFRDISFSIKRGEIVAFAGLVGAGRTEVGRAIFGAEPCEEGELYLDGNRIHCPSPMHAIKNGIGYLTEDRKSQGLFLSFSIQSNLVANHLRDFVNRIRFLQENSMNRYAEGSVKQYRIAAPSVDQTILHLSGGNQQKVLVGTWFGITPKLLIVDEPTRGVDVGAKSEIYAFLRGLARQGVAIMMISSDLSEVLGMSDRIIVMRSGRIVAEIAGSEATEEVVIAHAAGAGATKAGKK